MMLSVLCTEDAPRLARLAPVRDTAGFMLGRPIASELLRACQHWPAGELPPDYALPVRSDVPVLMLSGALDPSPRRSWPLLPHVASRTRCTW
jgi:hypothetical protein